MGCQSVAEDIAKDEDKLTELPGVGENMAEHIREILKTGDYSLRQKLLKKYPSTILDLLELQSLGPKKVAFLWSNFKVATVEGVAQLAREEKLRDLPGFGEKSEQNILKAAEGFKHLAGSTRIKIDLADAEAQKLAAYISKACLDCPKGRISDARRFTATRSRDRRRSRPIGHDASGTRRTAGRGCRG